VSANTSTSANTNTSTNTIDLDLVGEYGQNGMFDALVMAHQIQTKTPLMLAVESCDVNLVCIMLQYMMVKSDNGSDGGSDGGSDSIGAIYDPRIMLAQTPEGVNVFGICVMYAGVDVMCVLLQLLIETQQHALAKEMMLQKSATGVCAYDYFNKTSEISKHDFFNRDIVAEPFLTYDGANCKMARALGDKCSIMKWRSKFYLSNQRKFVSLMREIGFELPKIKFI